MPDTVSTLSMPCIDVMSSAMPPFNGIAAPQTPLRPPLAVTAMRLSLQ